MLKGRMLLFLAMLLGGCNQYYFVNAPDIVASAGGDAVAVVRLHRIDPYYFTTGVKDAAMRFRFTDGNDLSDRGSYTDPLGYAGAVLPAPVLPGVYTMNISHLDKEGDEVFINVPVFVWPADKPVLAVDLDMALRRGPSARLALANLAGRMNLIYLTRTDINEHQNLHRQIKAQNYPDGPVMLWQRQDYRIMREGAYSLPKIVVDTRLVSQLALLKKVFPGLQAGLCDSELAAKTFRDAGLKVIAVDGLAAGDRRVSWQELAEKGL